MCNNKTTLLHSAGSESHFKVVVVSEVFDGLPLIKVKQPHIDGVLELCMFFVETQIGNGHFEAGVGWWSSCTVYTGTYACWAGINYAALHTMDLF